MDVGDTVGSFLLTDKIGAGGMGAVYLAQHKLIGRKAAVKVLLPELSTDPDITARFFNEAKAATAIQHPSIVGIFDFGHHESGCAFIVMEYLDGESLAARLKKQGRLPLDHAFSITRQVAGALGAAHSKGIVHRDLKPDNVMLVPDPEVRPFGERAKVLDFGIAKLISAGGGMGNKTRTGSVIGTPAYMSPEQCKGTGGIDQRADIYSLGCMLYEFLTGRTPFVSDGFGELIAAHIYSEPAPPSRIEPSIPPPLDALIMKMLAKNADDRPQSMEAVQGAIDEIMGVETWGRSTSVMTPLPRHDSAANKTVAAGLQRAPTPKPQSFPGIPGFAGATPPPGGLATAPGRKPAAAGGGTALLSPDALPDAAGRTPTTLSKAIGQQGADAPAKKGRGALYAALGGGVLVVGGVIAFLATRGGSGSKDDGNQPAVAAKDPGKTDPVKTEAPKTDPVKTEAPKTDPVKTEAPKTDPVKTEPAPPAKVTLTLDSVPQGADVYRAADGIKLGKTPYQYSTAASPGEAEFLIKMAGFADIKVSLPADKDGTQKIELVAVKKVIKKGGSTAKADPGTATPPVPDKTPVKTTGDKDSLLQPK